MTRRHLSAVLVPLLALALAACGSSQKRSAATQPVHTVTVAPAGVVANPNTSANTSGDSSANGALGVDGAPTTAATSATGLEGLLPPFSAQSPWNTMVTQATIAPNSQALLTQVEKRSGVVVNGRSLESLSTTTVRNHKPLYINDNFWTDPIVFTNDGSAVKLVCRQVNLPPPHNNCGDGWEVSSLAVPVTQFPRPSYDGWLTVIDQGTGYAYDFWRARFTSNNTVLSYQFVRRWNLNGPGFLSPGQVAARGSGLPLFAGEILPHDIITGAIHHALAISLPGPASIYYVQPASSTDGNGLTSSLPEGARIRLNPSFDIDAALRRLPGRTNLVAARAIMTALKTYGAIVVDRSKVPTLYAVPNYPWNRVLRGPNGVLVGPNGHTPLPASLQNPGADGTPLLSGNVLYTLHVRDFQVVTLPTLQQYPPLQGVASTGGLPGVSPQPVPGQQANTTLATANVTAGSSGAVSGGLIP